MLGETRTNGDGAYSLSGVAEGPCRLEFSLTGFKTVVVEDLVSANTELTRIATMQVGSIQETVSGVSPAAAAAGQRPGYWRGT